MLQNEQQLIKQCKQRSEKAMLHLYDNYCDAMFSVCKRYLKNHEDAKDAMQEGFLKAFDSIHLYKSTHTFGVWIKRIVINQCIDVLRQKQLDYSHVKAETLQVIDDINDWCIDEGITKYQIVEAIEKLNLKYKIVVKLFLIEGYDHEEISEILQIPITTSRTHLRRGRLKLKELLKEDYEAARY